MNTFAQVFVEQVVAPWQKHCAGNEFPWEATPELRKKWLGGIASSDPATALSSAIGLSRCAKPNDEELTTVNKYFSQPPPDITTHWVILDLLLTGASPPVVLSESFFMPNMKTKPVPSPLFWPFLSSYLRHPSNSELSKNMLTIDTIPAIALYNAYANPLLPFPEKHPENPWLNALKIFHPKTPLPEISSFKSPLERFAFFMRCDFPRDKFLELSREVILDDPYFFAQLNHPCALSGAPPEYDPQNPSLKAIQHFANDTPVCSLYRFYNPLLNYPWMAEDIASSQDDGVFMGLLLMGSAPLQMEQYHALERKNIAPLIQQHPAWEVNLLSKYGEKLMEEEQKKQASPPKESSQ